jgi:HK97 family phage major capsid protein
MNALILGASGQVGQALIFELEKRHWRWEGTYFQHPEVDPRLFRAASGSNEAVPSDGGYLVQPDFEAELMKRVYETGALASRVRSRQVSGNGLVVNGIDETSRATGSRYGGVRGYWADEAATVTATAPKFSRHELKLKKLMALYYATDEILEDAQALEAEAGDAFREEFAWLIDNAILRGPGGGQPLGILKSGALVTVAKESGQTAATVLPENLVKMWSRMWAKSRGNAVWFINQDVEPSLFTMGLQVGVGGNAVYMPPGGLSAAPYGTLFGRPVIPIEQTSTIGTVGDIVLADLSQYRWIDKGAIKSASSIHVRFLYDEMTFRFTYRCDGQPSWQSALTPANGTNTLSPFVALATRS